MTKRMENMPHGLKLRRRLGESVKIGESMVVTVVEIAGGSVKLNFQADKSIAVLRSELLASSAKSREIDCD